MPPLPSFRVYWDYQSKSASPKAAPDTPVLCAGWCRMAAANAEAARNQFYDLFPRDRVVAVEAL